MAKNETAEVPGGDEAVEVVAAPKRKPRENKEPGNLAEAETAYHRAENKAATAGRHLEDAKRRADEAEAEKAKAGGVLKKFMQELQDKLGGATVL